MPAAPFRHRAKYLVNTLHRKYDLSSLVGRTGQHLVRPPSFSEREQSAHLGDQFSAIKQFRERAQPGRGDVYQEEH